MLWYFIGVLTFTLGLIYTLSFKYLTRERWQIFAAVPLKRIEGTKWKGVNITYYGIFTATGFVLGLSIFIIMAGSDPEGPAGMLVALLLLLLLFVPSAKIMAIIVEGKKHTLTVGGASFVMIIASPVIAAGVNFFTGFNVNTAAFLAVLLTAYAFGESFGRLACISFGCCYGRPVESMSPAFRKIFSRMNFVFYGETKKISYHDNLDEVEVVPIQGITAVIYGITGIICLVLYYTGYTIGVFFIALCITQLWRFLSEFLRADYRGSGKISAYQIMSIITIPYFIMYFYIAGLERGYLPDLYNGISFIWNPLIIIILQIMWAGALLYTGRSSVTESEIKFSVVNENI
jgi:hypothetical protein